MDWTHLQGSSRLPTERRAAGAADADVQCGGGLRLRGEDLAERSAAPRSPCRAEMRKLAWSSSNSKVRVKLTQAPELPTRRAAAGESAVRSSPSDRSRGQHPAWQAARWQKARLHATGPSAARQVLARRLGWRAGGPQAQGRSGPRRSQR